MSAPIRRNSEINMTRKPTDLERARRIARAMRDGRSTIGSSGRNSRGEMSFHRPGSPYGGLGFDPGDCAEAGRLFLRLLGKVS